MIFPIKLFQKTKYCLRNSGCYEHIQYCNKETYGLYGHCEYSVRYTIRLYYTIGKKIISLLMFFSSGSWYLSSSLACWCSAPASCCSSAAVVHPHARSPDGQTFHMKFMFSYWPHLIRMKSSQSNSTLLELGVTIQFQFSMKI